MTHRPSPRQKSRKPVINFLFILHINQLKLLNHHVTHRPASTKIILSSCDSSSCANKIYPSRNFLTCHTQLWETKVNQARPGSWRGSTTCKRSEEHLGNLSTRMNDIQAPLIVWPVFQPLSHCDLYFYFFNVLSFH